MVDCRNEDKEDEAGDGECEFEEDEFVVECGFDVCAFEVEEVEDEDEDEVEFVSGEAF